MKVWGSFRCPEQNKRNRSSYIELQSIVKDQDDLKYDERKTHSITVVSQRRRHRHVSPAGLVKSAMVLARTLSSPDIEHV